MTAVRVTRLSWQYTRAAVRLDLRMYALSWVVQRQHLRLRALFSQHPRPEARPARPVAVPDEEPETPVTGSGGTVPHPPSRGTVPLPLPVETVPLYGERGAHPYPVREALRDEEWWIS